MQEIFEKIKERLERERDIHKSAYDVAIQTHERAGYASYARACDEAIEIVNQVAEEYKHGHFGCNWNGQHERCKDCGLRGECSHCNTEWFGGKDINVHSNEFCEWIRDNDEFDVYDTKCRNRHVFFEGSPEDNEYVYCPYCGKEIKVIGD